MQVRNTFNTDRGFFSDCPDSGVGYICEQATEPAHIDIGADPAPTTNDFWTSECSGGVWVVGCANCTRHITDGWKYIGDGFYGYVSFTYIEGDCSHPTCVTAERQNEILVIDPATLAMGVQPNLAVLQWLWGDQWASSMTVRVDSYLQFYARSNYTYDGECGASSVSNAALKLFSTVYNNHPDSNLYFAVSCGKSRTGDDSTPMTCTNMPFQGTCATTNIEWRTKNFGRAVMNWNFLWK